MKVGRNEMCPCGSGKKFKRCCIPRLNELNDGATLRTQIEELVTPPPLVGAPCSGDESDKRRNAIQTLLFRYSTLLRGPPAELARNLEYVLMSEFPPTPLATMALEQFNTLPPRASSIVYWRELDCVFAFVSRWLINSIQGLLLDLADDYRGYHVRIAALRSILDFGSFLAFYRWGCWLGRGILRRGVETVGVAWYRFEDLEAFLRGPLSLDKSRLEAAERIAGSEPVFAEIAGGVGEITATIAKQGAVLEEVCKSAQIGEYWHDISDAYYLCCGVVHPTSLHLSLTYSFDRTRGLAQRLEQTLEVATARALDGILRLLRVCPLDYPLIDAGPDFMSVVEPVFPVSGTPDKLVMLESAVLRDVKVGDKKVKGKDAHGDEWVVYDGRRRSK